MALPSPGASSGGLPFLLTWPAAHSLWHAGQIRSFPSPEQSVAPELWGESTGGPCGYKAYTPTAPPAPFGPEEEHSFPERADISIQDCLGQTPEATAHYFLEIET